jgi:hypothetical protein
MFKVPEENRIETGPMGTDGSYGNNGAFYIPVDDEVVASVIAREGEGWEHVSVSLPHRTPTWREMCKAKDMFWEETDLVMQLHPGKCEYFNNHNYCLHLWRPKDQEIPTPDKKLL